MADTADLLLLVSVLAQALFTLVRRHLMSFSLFSAWHNKRMLILFLLFHGVDENLGRLESRDVMSGDGHGRLLGDVAGGLLSPMLDDEAAETTKVNGLLPDD